MSAARAPRSWSAAAVAGLTGAIVVASAPSLLPALLIAWVVWMLANPRRSGRLLTLIVPTAALLAPLVVDQLRRGTPLGLLADPGFAAPPGAVSAPALLLGWPAPDLVLAPLTALLPGVGAWALLVGLAALAAPLVVLAVLGLALPQGRRSIVPLVLAALGLVTAWAVAGISVSVAEGRPVLLDPAPALSLLALGIALAAGIALDGLQAVPQRRAPRAVAGALAAVAVIAAALAVAPLVVVAAMGGTAVAAREPSTLPALVAAEAQRDPALGTIVLTPVEGGLAVRLERGAGSTLIGQRTVEATAVLAEGDLTAAAESLALLAGNLAAPSGRDVAPELDALDVRFVLLEQAAPSVAGSTVDSVTAALDGNAVLAPVGEADAGRLWRVVPDDASRTADAERPTSSAIVLAVQLGILALTLLLAVPTSLRPRRARADVRADDAPASTFEAGDDDD